MNVRHALLTILFLGTLLWVAPARAVPMSTSLIVNNASGSTDAFQGDFLLSWKNLGSQSNNEVSGTWAGGSWTMVTTTFLNPIDNDVGVSFTLRTVWNDGWNPGGIGDLGYFSFGTNFSDAEFTANYNHPPLIAEDFSGLGLEYLLYADPLLDGRIGSDGTAGKLHFTWDMTRIAAVPERGSSWLLLAFSLVLIAGARGLAETR